MNNCKVTGCDRPHKGHGYCSPHYQRWSRYGSPQADKPLRPHRNPSPGFLWCRSCGLEKPDSEITASDYIRSRGWNTGECKKCKSTRNPQSPDTKRRIWLRNAYRLTVEQYEALLLRQNGVCAICGQPPKKNQLHVDHDHSCCPGRQSCGKCIRGLLCSRCNSAVEWVVNHSDAISQYLSGSSLRD